MTKALKAISFVILLLICYLKGYATAQIPDILVIGKDTFSMYTNPLEFYLDSIGNRELPELKGGGSTACWRGYQAVWRIENDSMFLEKIRSCHRRTGSVDANLQKMFHDKYKNGRVHAYWFTGLIVLPHGKLKDYVHMGYGSTYSKYLLLEINNGNFEKELKLNYRQYEKFKTRQYELFKETPEYWKVVEELMTQGYTDQNLIDSFLKNFIIQYTSTILEE